MRAMFVMPAALIVAAAPVSRAQCTAAVQKLINERKFDAARSEVRLSLNRNANDDVALHCAGMIALADNKPDEAIDAFEKAVKANDKSAAHHAWLGNALGEQASHTSKLKLPFLARRVKGEFDKAVQLDPASIDARHGLIEYYSHAPSMMGGSMDKAKEQAREIGRINPMRGHLEMAALLEGDKDVAGAEREFSAAIAAAPDSATTYAGLGNFYRRQKRYDDAVVAWERLLKAKPDAVNAHLNIAWSLALSGQSLDRAEREVRFWLTAAPKDASIYNTSTAHYLLGDIYQRRTRTSEARAEYQLALQINPRNAEAKKALEALEALR